MDPVALGFYGLVCGALGVVSPRLGRPFRRMLIGLVVGLVAAASLPLLRGVLAF